MEVPTKMQDNREGGLPEASFPGLHRQTSCATRGHRCSTSLPGRTGQVDPGNFPALARNSFLEPPGAGRCFGLPGPFPGGH